MPRPDPEDCSYEEYITFVFDRPMQPEDWYRNETWPVSQSTDLVYITKLFNEPELLIEKYKSKQINLGLKSHYYATDFRFVLWDIGCEFPEPWELRQKCIQSMENLFVKLFNRITIQDSCYMWWDMLMNVDQDQNSFQVRDEMCSVMEKILELESVDCQISALHGLGHFQHPDTEKIINRFLEKRIVPDGELKQFAQACIKGKIL